VNALVVKELRLRHAQLDERAERLRQEWRNAPSTGPRALALGKEVHALQDRADGYAALLRVAEGMEP
jgi:hypothetical protein